MAIYALRNTASLEVLSIVEYDGSSSYSYLTELGLELYSGSMIEEFTAQEHTPYDLYDPIHGLHITSEVGSVLKGFNYISGSLSLIGDVYSTGSQYLEGELNLVGGLNALGDVIISGSLNISGSVVLGDENFDEIFKIAPTPCTILKYEEDVINQLPTDGGLNPQGGYFIFDKDTSINGSQYGENSWRLERPTKIRLNLQSLGETAQQNDYEEKLFRIIRERLGSSQIELSQILPNNLTAAYKKFEIIRGIYRERSIRKDANREYPVRYYYLDWGSQNFEETDRYFGQEDIDYFYGDGPFGLDFSGIGTNSARDGFFEFEVKQLEPLSINPDIKPEQDAEFKVCVKSKEYRREITVFETSGEYQFPYWADQITIYSVGAGGGGGGGAWGYPHKKIFNPTNTGRVYAEFLTLDSRIGYDFAIGGGGGAGGSVAISSFSNKDIANGTKLSVFVGTPGKAGLGLQHNQPYNDMMGVNFVTNDVTLQCNPIATALCGGIENYLPTTSIGPYDSFPILDQNRHPLTEIKYDPDIIRPRVVIPSNDNIGKKGGDSFVTKPNGDIVVKAQGGSGGNCGFSVQWAYPAWSHMTCNPAFAVAPGKYTSFSRMHTFDVNLFYGNMPSLIALGGGGSTQESMGDIVRSGGHGGYGICTLPYYNLKPLTPDTLRSDEAFGFNHIFDTLNVAPNIPWNMNSDLPGLKVPMGRLDNNLFDVNSLNVGFGTIGVVLPSYLSLQNFNIHNLSKEKPYELAPPGGGGGVGIRYDDLDVVRTTYEPTNKYPADIWDDSIQNFELITSTDKLFDSTSTYDAAVYVDNNEIFIKPGSFFFKDVIANYSVSLKNNADPNPGEITLDTNRGGLSGLIKIHILDADGIDRESDILYCTSRMSSPSFNIIFKDIMFDNKKVNILTVGLNTNGVKKVNDFYEIDITRLVDVGTILSNTIDSANIPNNQNLKVHFSKSKTDELDFNGFYTRFYDNIKNIGAKSIYITTTSTKSNVTDTQEAFVYEIVGPMTLSPTPNNLSINGISIPIKNIVGVESYNLTTVYNVLQNVVIAGTNVTPSNFNKSFTIYFSKNIWSDFIDPTVPIDGFQRFFYNDNRIRLGSGGKILLNDRYLVDATDSNGQNVKIEFGNGGNGGFGEYHSPSATTLKIRPDLSNTLPENVSNRKGVGGGGGAAVYLKQYDDKNRIGDPDVPSKGQDGADGAPGIVVIIADKYSF